MSGSDSPTCRLASVVRPILLSTICVLTVIVLCARPALGWGVPSTIVEDPKGPEDYRHAKMETGDYGFYHVSPHAYIIEHAAEILEAENNGNWAGGTLEFHQALVDGCMWPDRMGQNLTIYVSLWETIPFPIKVKTWQFRVCNEASMDHYYNPDRAAATRPATLPAGQLPAGQPLDPTGLDLVIWDQIEGMAMAFAPILSSLGAAVVGLDALAFATTDIEPDVRQHYESSAVRAEQFYQLAVKAWNGQIQPLPGRGYEETALYYLGAACHYVGDAAVVNHTYDCFLGNHEDYESFAAGKGGNYEYHAQNASIAARIPINGLPTLPTAYDYVARCAAQVHDYNHFQQVEGPGASTTSGADALRTIKGIQGADFGAALRYAMPIAEVYTAGLIAKFFKDIQVPAQTPPLLGGVFDTQGNPLPGIYVFYTEGGAWSHTRTDAKGTYRIPALRGSVMVRPAHPNYNYEGGYTQTMGGPGEAFGNACPVTYNFKGFATGSDLLSFRMKPLPKEGVVGAVLNFDGQQPAQPAQTPQMVQLAPQTMTQMGAAQLSVTGQRLAMEMPPPLNLQPVLASGASLQLSGSQVSARMAERVCNGLLRFDFVSAYRVAALANPISPEQGIVERNRPWGNQIGEMDVQVEVKHYIDMMTGQLVTTQAQLINTIDAARAKFAKARSGQLFPQLAQQVQGVQSYKQLAQISPGQVQPGQIDMGLVQGLQLAANALPASTVQLANGKTVSVITVPGSRDELGAAGTLLGHGLLPIPASSGVQLQASIVPGPGYVGTIFAQPLTLTTDAQGRAAFRILSGTHAGKMRVAIRVTSDPLVQYAQPSQSLDILVTPIGTIDGQVIHPALMALKPWDAPDYTQPAGGGLPQQQQQPGVILQGAPPVQGQQPGVVVGPTGPVVGPDGQVTGPGGPIIQQGQPAVLPQPGMGSQVQTGAGMMSETFDTAQPQGWELFEGAQVVNGALTFPTGGGAFWMTPPTSNPGLAFKFMPGNGFGVVGLCAAGEPPQNQSYELHMHPGEVGLIRLQAGQGQELGGAPVQMQSNTWNDILVQVNNGQIQVSVGGQVVLTASDPQPLGPGQVMLAGPAGGGASYDNVALMSGAAGTQMPGGQTITEQPPGQPTVVQPQPGVVGPAQQTGATLSQDFEGRQPQGWEFDPTASVANGMLAFAGPGHAFWVQAQGRNIALSFRHRPAAGECQVIFCASGEPPNGSSYNFVVSPGGMELVRITGQQIQALGRAQAALTPGEWFDLSIAVTNGQITVTVGGQQVITATDPQPLPAGTVGFGQIDGQGAAFDDVSFRAQ